MMRTQTTLIGAAAAATLGVVGSASAAPALFSLPAGIEMDAAVGEITVLNADGSSLFLPAVSLNSFTLPYSERAETIAMNFTNAGTGLLNASTELSASLSTTELLITAESSVTFEVPGSTSPFVQAATSGFVAGSFFLTEDATATIELLGSGRYEMQIERLGPGAGVVARIDEDGDASLLTSVALSAGEYSIVFDVGAGVNGSPFSGTLVGGGVMRLVIPAPGSAAALAMIGLGACARRRRA